MTGYSTGEAGSHVADVLALFREQGEVSRNAVMEQTGLSAPPSTSASRPSWSSA